MVGGRCLTDVRGREQLRHNRPRILYNLVVGNEFSGTGAYNPRRTRVIQPCPCQRASNFAAATRSMPSALHASATVTNSPVEAQDEHLATN